MRYVKSLLGACMPRNFDTNRIPIQVFNGKKGYFKDPRSLSFGKSSAVLYSSQSRNAGLQQHNIDEKDENKGTISSTSIGVLSGILIGSYVVWKLKNAAHDDNENLRNYLYAAAAASPGDDSKLRHNYAIPNLPEYKLSQVAEHYNKEKRVWVTFGRGVYDVTDFIAKHPGGDRILMAAGGSLEPFWELYPVHQRSDIFDILEKHRIGNLAESDLVILDPNEKASGHFKNEPRRHPCLLIRVNQPFNGETPPSLLTEKFYTPNELFYVRNHLPVPQVDPNSYQLEVSGLQIPKEKTFNLSQLKKFPQYTMSATIQCGGNRRTEMGSVGPVAGLGWTGGGIGNAKWTGVRLKDVLRAAGFKVENYKNPDKLHVQFEGLDSDQSGECYGSSIPFSYMLDDNFQPLLAFQMNDKELPVDHGFPVRIILPGIVGARNVKWLSRIIISEQESPAPWQQRDYKVFSPKVTMETVDFSSAPAIQDLPVVSYICNPENGQKIPKNQAIEVQGYAFSGGGRKIVRVEISLDAGKNWDVAELIPNGSEESTKNWSWYHWKFPLNLKTIPKSTSSLEIWVKAVDSGYNQQSEDFKNIYNYRGLLSNAYHKIKINCT